MSLRDQRKPNFEVGAPRALDRLLTQHPGLTPCQEAGVGTSNAMLAYLSPKHVNLANAEKVASEPPSDRKTWGRIHACERRLPLVGVGRCQGRRAASARIHASCTLASAALPRFHSVTFLEGVILSQPTFESGRLGQRSLLSDTAGRPVQQAAAARHRPHTINISCQGSLC